MIYFDNSATTYYKPYCVKRAVINALYHLTANPGRGGYRASLRTDNAVTQTRIILAKTFNNQPERVIFTSGCTEALNLAILGTVKQGGHIICSCFEHNSVLRVLEHLKQQGDINYTIVTPTSQDGRLSQKDISSALQDNTYMLIINHISNVIGVKQDLTTLGTYAKQKGLLFLVDGAQSAGTEIIDMKKHNISMLALAGHKSLYGIQGVGALLLAQDTQLKPIKFGGTGSYSQSLAHPIDFPEGYESGTLPTPAIISLGAGTRFAYKTLKKRKQKESLLYKKLYTELSSLDKITIYTPPNATNNVLAFNIKDIESSEVADWLDRYYNIAVRSGLQCAPCTHKYLDTLHKGGVIRVSINYRNTKSQINKLLRALKKFLKQKQRT